jgi:ankyrin repeat protein
MAARAIPRQVKENIALSSNNELLGAFETHDSAAIRNLLAAGCSPTASIDGKSPLTLLAEMYTRTSRFADCLRVLLDSGASFNDPLLESLLLDDADQLGSLLQKSSGELTRRFHLNCAYTPLAGASPLHVCAEYNSVHCARVLLDAGHPVDATATIDANGFGGHTPLFHTVNSNRNYCRPMMQLLIDAGARLDVHLKGIVWGSGFEWETTILDVTPFSYAQCGLYFQFHRREDYIYSNLAYLYHKKYGQSLALRNVPNKYLQDSRVFPARM